MTNSAVGTDHAHAAVRVRIPSPLLSYTAQQADVAALGDTLDNVLRDLDRQFPGIRFRVVDEQDRMRPHMIFFVNREKVFALDHPVGRGDEVRLVHALSGG